MTLAERILLHAITEAKARNRGVVLTQRQAKMILAALRRDRGKEGHVQGQLREDAQEPD